MTHPIKNNDMFLAKWLSNEISDDELKTHISQQDFDAYVKIRKGLHYFNAPEFDSDKLFRDISGKIKKKKNKVTSLKWYYAAAVIAVLFLSAYFYNYYLPTSIYTGFAEHKAVVLNDGSKAILNSKSHLSYPKKWKDKRVLTLQGEAFFEVKKGNTFTVKTKNGNITVLGTKFNVNSQSNFLSVKCFKGLVRVVQNTDTIYLSKGNAYQNNNVQINKWNFKLEKPYWIDGESNFKSTPLKIIITSLENQFGYKIISSDIDEDQLFTGSFSHDDFNIALESVFLPMNVKYKVENKKVYLSKK